MFGEAPTVAVWGVTGGNTKDDDASEVLLLSVDTTPVRKVIRKDGEHTKTDYYGGHQQYTSSK